MVSALDQLRIERSGFSRGWGHCVVFMGKTTCNYLISRFMENVNSSELGHIVPRNSTNKKEYSPTLKKLAIKFETALI